MLRPLVSIKPRPIAAPNCAVGSPCLSDTILVYSARVEDIEGDERISMAS